MASAFTLLTGATGFLGRYLLRELLAAGPPVAVLARDSRNRTARQRVDELVAFGGGSLVRALPPPVVLCGDLGLPGLGLQAADRAWLEEHCRAVVHAAACVTLRGTPYGEPWRTNVEGTQRLLDVCRAARIAELHHVSTAFVCGKRQGEVREDELDAEQEFHNEYEQSKCEAERRVRSAAGVRATIYRPSVIVGDSVTGHTSSYHAFYRFLELGYRLAQPTADGRLCLPLRVPFRGDERRNLVPVDWVARVIAAVVARPGRHGRTYHLSNPELVPVRVVKEVAEAVLGVDGVCWGGRGEPREAGTRENTFLEHLDEYRPYLGDDPTFDCRNTQTAVPDLPCPRIDRDVLARLIRFAVADSWGRASRGKAPSRARHSCADYVERFFPESAGRSSLARVPLDVSLGLEVRGPGGGRWAVRLRPGEPPSVTPGPAAGSAVVYRTDGATFEAVVRGRQTPQQAFFEHRIEIVGDVERALKLAVLFGEFVRECPYPARPVAEKSDGMRVPV
jgi:thioester reductase-like protein